MRLDEILAVVAPTRVSARAWIRGRIRNLRPNVVLRSGAVLEFVVDEILEKFQRVRIASIGIKPLDEALHHGAQITGRVYPVGIRRQLVRGAVKIKAAVEVRKPLPIKLVPYDSPLRKKMRRVRVARVIGHGPRKKLVLGIERNGPPGDGGLVDRGDGGKRMLR